ncbi:uncharacterized protein LOC132796686 [Drosophila nasuta]|uniref:uncharacterized protein LOC132796686 n=1 Tax=Drosophila nasuta TaxID=42062 RepID=UPI00295F2481|nr:uncharacterized protein LOC132796686 [Drosophila nasuta]XP_060663922.1 uncharacterized protein LOC132796686 [Drosophila nasuta]
MRRSRVNSASLASASIAAQTQLSQLSHRHHPETTTTTTRTTATTTTRRQHQHRNELRFTELRRLRSGLRLRERESHRQGLNLIRLLAVVAVIGQRFALGTSETTAAAGTSTSVAIEHSRSNNHNNTENNFYFDEHNTTKTITFIPVDTLATIPDVGQMPDATTTTTTTTITTGAGSTTAGRATAQVALTSEQPSMRDQTIGIINSNNNNNNHHHHSTTIKSSSAIDSLVTLGLATASSSSTSSSSSSSSSSTTTKSARSTAKQPNDSTKSRNHWTFGGAPDAERSRTFRSKYHHENHYGPFFEEPSTQIDPGKTLVAAVHLFTEAVLNCRVGMLKDKTVMWVRRTTEKVSLLTVGNVTYSGDPRIRVKFQYPNNWRLLINPTQREDAGIYMCQVSTHPPRVFTTNLTILEPPLRIIDEHERGVGDRYYKSGSTVDLQCQISRNFFQKERNNIFKSTESGKLNDTGNELNLNLNLISDANQTHTTFTSQELEKYFTNFITWAKDEEPLQALTNRRSSVSDKWLTSRISIPEAKLSDSGNYSCSLGRLFTVIVQVQVLTGELPAAVQHNLARKSGSCLLLSWSLFIIVICFYMLKNHSSQFHSIKLLSA